MLSKLILLIFSDYSDIIKEKLRLKKWGRLYEIKCL
jgi:hypothetical protein